METRVFPMPLRCALTASLVPERWKSATWLQIRSVTPLDAPELVDALRA